MFIEVTTFDNTTIFINVNKIVAVKSYNGQALLYFAANIYSNSNYITLKHTQEDVMNAIRSATGDVTVKVE